MDPEQRERESAKSDETKYEEAVEREAEKRRRAVERLRDDPLPEPDEDET